MVLLVNLLLFIIILINFVNTNEVEFCSKDIESCGNKYINNKRYILYDVNQPEGFNLRRDVYIRIAVFIKSLINHDHKYQWHLVLPPWSNLYHWKSNTIKQKQLPWSLFFDIESLNKYVKVIELYEFIEEYNGSTVDKVFVLQNDPKMFETGDFKDKNKIVECNKVRLNRELFWGYNNITANEIICIEFHGTASQLVVNLNPSVDKSFMFDHMEIPLHDYYGSVDFWLARRSMRYNKELYEIANEFRKKYLNSTDKNDKTIRPPDWKDEKSKRNAVGGPYLAIHLRRGDFLIGRSDTVPTIKNAANQVIKKLKKLELKTVFVATDAENSEYIELTKHLTGYNVYKYLPTEYHKNKFKDGGIAIIDQIISSHAKYFIGTYESTFTFRIQEDREILGLPIKSTFNTFCGKKKCPKSSQWTIIYE
ncbi:GDP-fucose protein O-fucosyltransferase 2 isoform X1 [Cotesia glomerata]|uniref:GDP-fucose protein O-fucosyltransferase 2 isoform X1 n=1 Tax=Cotesia glomerata TaxID=32391 RepID=UPI001D00C0D1|nr:GDP-fucose protein O-fucosyltransferase 2 isoform X1 [Cotesia glomerata]